MYIGENAFSNAFVDSKVKPKSLSKPSSICSISVKCVSHFQGLYISQAWSLAL